MYKILTYNNIAVSGLERFPRDKYEVASEIQHPDALILRSYNLHGVEIAASLQAVGRAGAGVNNIPVDEYSALGVPVFNAPGANANAVKELVIAGMLLGCRNICHGWNYARGLHGDDQAINTQVEKNKKQFVGFELPGKTLGVIGLGAIGVKVANAAQSLGMHVVGYDPGISVENAWNLSSSITQARRLGELIERADFVSLHVPLNDKTRNIVDADCIKTMKEGAVILNFSRSGIVSEDDIVDGLDGGKLYAYVCDFPNNRLKDHARVIALPHMGASTREAEENCAIMVAEQVKDYLENGNIKNSVNFPDVFLPRVGACRLGITNRNMPNMVSQISGSIAEADLNILELLNKSKGDVAYTLIDVDCEVVSEAIEHIRQIEGVLSARVV